MTTEPQADIVERLRDRKQVLRDDGTCRRSWAATSLDLAAATEITRLRAELAEARDDASIWRPAETAPKDGSYILVRLAVISDERWAHLSGRAFVVRHEGKTLNGYDLGWALHPGFGGAPDHWIDAWQAIDPATLLKDADEVEIPAISNGD